MVSFILYGLLAFLAISLVINIAEEFMLTWKGLTDMGMRHTPNNFMLLFYCRFEAANLINMNAIHEALDKRSSK